MLKLRLIAKIPEQSQLKKPQQLFAKFAAREKVNKKKQQVKDLGVMLFFCRERVDKLQELTSKHQPLYIAGDFRIRSENPAPLKPHQAMGLPVGEGDLIAGERLQ